MPIRIIDNFTLNSALPIDGRMVATNSTHRDLMPYKYDGMKVFQSDIRTTYVWDATAYATTGVTSSSWTLDHLGFQGPQGRAGVQGPTGVQGWQGNVGVTGYGLQGLQGWQGTTGVQGWQGDVGVTGYGLQGLQGWQGTTGVQGWQGDVGVTGYGLQGLQGPTGVQGWQGDVGVTGYGLQGWQGTTGVQGWQGDVGVTGYGLQGPQGWQGTTGVQGWQGDVGVTGYGLQGPQGWQGLVGPQGVQGITGSQGGQGIDGTQGNQGLQGMQGAAGMQGTQGIQGAVGPQGPQGATGAAIILNNADNRVLTSTGTAGEANAEQNLTFDGTTLKMMYQSGDEGGEFFLNKPVSNSTIVTGITIDVYQNKLRIFQGDSAKGAYIDMTALENSVGTNLAPYRYLYVTRNTTQTISSGTWANIDVIFNNVVASSGIPYDTSTGVATLLGGVYRITAQIAWSAASTYLFQWSCFDSANNQIGPVVEQIQPTSSSNNTSPSHLDFILNTTGKFVKIRMLNSTNALSGEYIRSDLNTGMIIQQIG